MPHWLAWQEDETRVWHSSPHRDRSGQPVIRVWTVNDSHFKIQYSDGTQFLLDRAGERIWATWPDTLTLEDTTIYLEGPILGFVLRLRGVVCLHSSSIVIDDHAVALVGVAGAGKSTLAATYASLGFAVLSEDVVALTDRCNSFLVQPGYPRVRLWPESFANAYGSSDSLPLLTPTWDKRFLDLTQNGYRFQSEPVVLGAIYILGERTTSTAAPFIEAIGARQSMMELVKNTYTNYLLDMPLRAAEFELLSRIVSRVPLRHAIPHTDPTQLRKLCDAIRNDFHSLVAVHS